MYWLAKHYLRLRGWTIKGAFPPDPKFLAIGAPHTSNFDFIVFIGVLGFFGRRARFIGKSSLFWGPFGWMMRKLGGIPVHRNRPEGLVEQTAAAFEESKEMILVVAPEGTRSRATMWKSGFYRIAVASGVPIVVASINGPEKVVIVGPPLRPSGDVAADMDKIREIYGGVQGVRPGNETPIKLAEEE